MKRSELFDYVRIEERNGVTLLKNTAGIHRNRYAILRDGRIVRHKMKRKTAIRLFRGMTTGRDG